MPIVTTCHLEIGTEIKREYILRVEIMKKKKNYRPYVGGYRVGNVAYF
jgi:hypothetical protein